MAKRTGAPARRQAAQPARHRQPGRPAASARSRWPYLLGGVIGLGAVAALMYALAFTGGAAPSVGVAIPDEGRQHVEAGTTIQYQHYPPASGPHYPSPAAWSVFTREVPEGSWVHNLEHGGVVLLYRCEGGDCAGPAARIQDLALKLPPGKFNETKFLATPYTKMEAPFTLVAWDHQQTLETLDEGAIQAFYRGYADRGPEDVP